MGGDARWGKVADNLYNDACERSRSRGWCLKCAMRAECRNPKKRRDPYYRNYKRGG